MKTQTSWNLELQKYKRPAEASLLIHKLFQPSIDTSELLEKISIC